MRMLQQREFRALDDPDLIDAFEAQRRAEMRQLVFLLAGFGAFGVALLWLQWWEWRGGA